MTVIAWDGNMLAADKLADVADLPRTVTKIWRGRDGCLIGGSGDFSRVLQMRDWYNAGADPSKFPEEQRNTDKFVTLVIIAPQKLVLVYELAPSPIFYEDPQYACGSGRDFAVLAMKYGEDARQAVLTASKYSLSCGLGVDTLTLEE